MLLADAKFPILGVDFLWHHNIHVDPIANKLLSVAATAHSPPAHVADVSTSSATMGTHQTAPAVWEVLCNELGIPHCFTTAYHPQRNGMIEQAHWQLKDSLRSRLAGVNRPQHLPEC